MEEADAKWRRWLRTDILLTLVAVVAGISGAVLGGQYLKLRAADAEARVARRYEERQVIVAAGDIARGTLLDAGNLALRSMPEQFVPAGSVPADRAAELVGAVAAIDLSRGMPIAPAMLVAAGSVPRLSAVLAIDERALTVAVDELDSHAGGLRVGDRVDLFYSRREGDRSLLAPLMQQVEILGVGDAFTTQQEEAGVQQFATVTLRVPAAEAPRILLAQQAGELSLLLRSREDHVLQPATVRSSGELLRQPVAPGRAMADVELLIGGQGEQVPERRLIRVGAGRAAGAS
jgi:pilus assembly protein CpaB